MLDSLLGRGDVPKCKNLIKVIKSRVDFWRKKSSAKVNMLRRDVTDLVMKGQHQNAFFRVELLLAEENVLARYEMIEIFCDCILKQPYSVQRKKDCPPAIKEAVSSLIFAAARCAEIPELQKLRGLFATRYGDEFAIAAVDLHPDCGVSQKIIENFSTNTPSNDAKLKLMKEIASKKGLQWDESNLEAKFCSSKDSQDASRSKCLPSSQKRVNSSREVVLDSEFSKDVEKQKTTISGRMEDSRSIRCEADAYERDIPVVSSSLREIPIIPDNFGKTSQVKQMKSFSSSRTKAHKSFSSLSDSNGQTNISFVDTDAASTTESVDHANKVRHLAVPGEKVSNKECIKAEMVDYPFNTGLESKEDHGQTRQAGNRSRENKNSCHAYKYKDLKMEYSNGNTSFPEKSRDLQTKYSNGHANPSFLEESKWVPEKDFGLRSASPLKSDIAYKTKFSDGPTEQGENGIQNGSHGRCNRPSRYTEQEAEYEAVRNTRPFGILDTDATEEWKSEFQLLSASGDKVGSKSSKRHPRSSRYDSGKGNMYENPCSFSATNGSDYIAVEPSVRSSMGRKMYDEGFQESSALYNSSINCLNKEEQTCQSMGDKIKNKVRIQMHNSHRRHDYQNELDAGDGTFTEVDKISAARYDPSPLHEKLSSRESGRKAYYGSTAATHEEVRCSYRRELDKGSKYLNTRSHGVTDNASPTGHEVENEKYHSVQETLYENTESNLNSFHRLPYESQKHREKGERTGRRLYTADDSLCKNIYHVDNHDSGSESHLKQPESRKEYTTSTYPQNLRRQDGKPRVGSENSLDSTHDIYDVHQNSVLQDQHFQGSESLGSYINETDMAGGKSERSRLDGRRGTSKSVEGKNGYTYIEEPFASSLADVHQSESSAKIRRYDRLQSENKEKVYTPRNSNVRIAEEGITQHTEPRDGIAEAKDSSTGKSRRQDIQRPESRRSRNTQSTHHIQSGSLQSEFPESPNVKKILKSSLSHSSINSRLPPLPPTCTSPESTCFSPEHSSQHRPSSSIIPGNGSPSQRPSLEHNRSASLPPASPVRSASMKSKLLKSSSDMGISNTAHVHPKLPNYDDLTAHFAALKQQCQSK